MYALLALFCCIYNNNEYIELELYEWCVTVQRLHTSINLICIILKIIYKSKVYHTQLYICKQMM